MSTLSINRDYAEQGAALDGDSAALQSRHSELDRSAKAKMKLSHLRTACYLYNQFTDYDSSYLELRGNFPQLELSQKDQAKALIKWLRSWGCRQFKNDDEDISVSSIMSWYELYKSQIPPPTDCLIDYDLTKNKKLIAGFFSDLSNRKAATKKRGGNNIDVRIGPVGAAKTLFALRPNLFSPWDTPIYKSFQLEGNGSGYVSYLYKIQNELKDVRVNVSKTSIGWNNLFDYLKKKHNSYPKLIDEYYWITITQGCDPFEIDKFFR